MAIVHGDALAELRKLCDSSIDAIVTDPPYGISFMGRKWDYDVPSVETWHECLRVMKPGAHALVACGTRTQHRMAVNLEDAGFEVRDVVAWLYGSGFPKSHDVSKAIDRAAGVADRERGIDGGHGHDCAAAQLTAPATEAARQWHGWGTALKPAMELWTLVRKPLSEKTVAANVLKWGTGALNIEACRVDAEKPTGWCGAGSKLHDGGLSRKGGDARLQNLGRWPANVTHDGSQQVLELFPQSKGQCGNVTGKESPKKTESIYGPYRTRTPFSPRTDTGSAARFFYCAKASKSERNAGLDDFDYQATDASNFRPNHTEKAAEGHAGTPYGRFTQVQNNHPTVKPVKLMLWLCNLITPPGGLVLDPFAGSGSTGIAAKRGGFQFIGIERELPYVEIAEARIAAANA